MKTLEKSKYKNEKNTYDKINCSKTKFAKINSKLKKYYFSLSYLLFAISHFCGTHTILCEISPYFV
jgi:hypothetical protein